MSKLRIYGLARTRAFRALWIAKELGLDYEHIPMEIGDAGARKPEYLALNPNGRLPAIDDNGFVLWESLAITLYLAKKHATGTLYPATLEGEAHAWSGACGRCRKSIAASTSGRCMPCGCRPRTVIRQRPAEALKVIEPPFRVLDGALRARPICSATTSRWPI